MKILVLQKLSLALILIALVRCSSTGTAYKSYAGADAERDVEVAFDLKPTRAPLIKPKHVDTGLKQHPQLMVQLNKQVGRWIEHFTTVGRSSFEAAFRRGEAFRPEIEAVLSENGIPKEFYYLAFIESGFTNHAVSHAGAVGLWQFIRGTAERYGLECRSGFDERRDPRRATRAAAAYLRDLYNVFGSWRLAMAAYNAGEYRVLRAVMRTKTRDFWTLVEKEALPAETLDYVPKFYAATIIARNPKKYGLDLATADRTTPEVTAVALPSPISLRAVATLGGIGSSTLAGLNPHLSRKHTPAWKSSYRVWIPTENLVRIKKSANKLRSESLALVRSQQLRRHAKRRTTKTRVVSSKRRASRRVTKRVHRVERGDTLYSIAKRYGTSIKWLKNVNSLTSNRLSVGKRLVVAGRSDTRQEHRSAPNT